MGRRIKLIVPAIIAAVMGAGIFAVFVPVIPGPNSTCPSSLLCIPDQKDSVSLHFLGYGYESSYGGRFYYFCTPWPGTLLVPGGMRLCNSR
jgi:hypothetical protein